MCNVESYHRLAHTHRTHYRHQSWLLWLCLLCLCSSEQFKYGIVWLELCISPQCSAHQANNHGYWGQSSQGAVSLLTALWQPRQTLTRCSLEAFTSICDDFSCLP